MFDISITCNNIVGSDQRIFIYKLLKKKVDYHKLFSFGKFKIFNLP